MVHVDRRDFLAAVAAGLLSPAGVLARAQAPDIGQERPATDLMKPETEKAIEAGLNFLAIQLNQEGCFGLEGYRRNTAVVSLAGLAWMANGSAPGRGQYGRQINQCVDYLLKNTQEDGYVYAPNSTSHGPMYGHGFATLFLAEVYGMWPDSDVREKLSKAIKLITLTQNGEGGWRYQPERRDADISVTICQVMALRAARNAGIFVSNDTIDRCTEYVKRCQNVDGGFSYMLPNEESGFPRTAAGVVALYSAGIYEGDEVQRGLDYLVKNRPSAEDLTVESHYFYGQYYAVQAMWYAGGEYWKNWYPVIQAELMKKRLDDGSWFDQICPEYGTAMACLILQMPKNYLPILQR